MPKAQASRCSTQAAKGLRHEPHTLASAAALGSRVWRTALLAHGALTKAKDRDAARSPEQGSPTGVDVLECRVQGTRARARASELRPPRPLRRHRAAIRRAPRAAQERAPVAGAAASRGTTVAHDGSAGHQRERLGSDASCRSRLFARRPTA